jgi:ABC-type glycerol-3-phosphate transport system permease component
MDGGDRHVTVGIGCTPPRRPQHVLPAERGRLGLVMAVAVIMMLPPVLIFAFLDKYFSVGGIGASLAGR